MNERTVVDRFAHHSFARTPSVYDFGYRQIAAIGQDHSKKFGRPQIEDGASGKNNSEKNLIGVFLRGGQDQNDSDVHNHLAGGGARAVHGFVCVGVVEPTGGTTARHLV